LSLAALEMLVHVDVADAPGDLVSIAAEIPADLPVKTLRWSRLSRRWRGLPSPEELARIGTGWVESGETCVLAVPSVVVAQEKNYLLNPSHSDLVRIVVEPAEEFRFDPRLLGGRPARPRRKSPRS